MALQIVSGINDEEKREVLAIQTMLEESFESYQYLFKQLEERGLEGTELVISAAHKGLQKAIREYFPGSS